MKTIFTLLLILIMQFAFAQSDTLIYIFVQEMPRFPGCEDLESDSTRINCARTEMTWFTRSQLKTLLESDAIYQTKRCADFVFIIEMVVEKDGSLSNFNLMRGPDVPECRAAALQVLQKMPHWMPGKQRGALVRVRTVMSVSID